MTVAANVEKIMARYAEAKAALWGKPKKTNIFVEERRAVEEYRKAQKRRGEEEERKKKEKKHPQSTGRKQGIEKAIMKKGTSVGRKKSGRRKRKNTRNPQAAGRKQGIEKAIMKKGTAARFCIENTVSYWCFDTREAAGLKRLRGMMEIAHEILASHPGVTIDDVRGPQRCRQYTQARWDVVKAIRERRPELSTPVIGRFVNRDHTTVLYILGMKKKRAA